MARAQDRLQAAGATSAVALALYAFVVGSHVGTIALARAISRTTTEGVPLWAAAGVSAAALLLSPRRLWPGVLIATFGTNLVSNLVLGIDLDTSALAAFANSVEPLVGALVVLHFTRLPPRLTVRRDLLVYLVGAVGVGPAVGALIGSLAIQIAPFHPPYLDVLGRWYTGDALGVLAVGSLLIAWLQPTRFPERRFLSIEIDASLTAVAVVGMSVIAFWGTAPVLAYTVLPPLAWAAIRFGPRGATLAGIAIAVIADWATIRDHGLFVELSTVQVGVANDEALWSLQLFLAVILLTALVLAVHVSELGAAERALHLSEERQRMSSLLESSPDPIVVLREDSTVAFLNEALLALTGRSREELISTRWVEMLPPEHRPRVLGIIATVLSQPEGTRSTFEMENLGQLLGRSLEMATSPLDTVDGRVVVASIRDVTERKANEAALRAAVEAAEAATVARTQFLATMSHEIRTPMSAVSSLIELLQHTSLDEEQETLVHTMRTSSSALLRIIDDTLDFSKIEAGKLEFEAVPVAVSDEIRAVASLMEPAASSRGISLACSCDPEEPPAVLGDPVRIRQILLNLVGNAIKFTSKGGVGLHATVEQAEGARAAVVTFTVRDSGIGIPPERQAELFRPFTQAEHSTTRLYGGTGLGLSIVSRLIQLMRGSVRVESETGQGSTFVVTLPLPLAPAGAVPTTRRSEEPATRDVDHQRISGHVVLIAEDNGINRDVLRRQLALLGCACEVAPDGQVALDRLQGGGISLLLTDCHMPVLDGFGLTRAIRKAEQEHADGHRLPVVAITANAMDGEGDRCLAAGMDAYLTKPVDLGRLAVVLTDLLPAEPAVPAEPLDLQVLRQIVGDDAGALLEMLELFASSVGEQADVLRAALAASESDRVTSAAHRVAGAAASVGAVRLASLARAVEHGGGVVNPDVLEASVGALVGEIDLVTAQVATLEGSHG